MAGKVGTFLLRAPMNAPAVKVAGVSRVTSNKGTPNVSINDAARPTTTRSGGKGK